MIKTIGEPKDWVDHVGAISAYVAIVLLVVPIVVGAGLNRYLATPTSGGVATAFT